MNIFYSWQSDTPERTGHYLIRDALQAAIDELNSELSLEEASRPNLDHDTKGLPGAPAIAEAILKKIDACNVFVADVSLVGDVRSLKESGEDDKKALVNSNVGIELGYALKSKGPEALLFVMNTAHGGPERLPFDLQHRRWPVQYSLPTDAAAAQIKSVKADLAAELKPILRAFMDEMAKPRGAELFAEAPTTVSPAHYFDPGEELVPTDLERGWRPSHCSEETLLYVRVHPKYAAETLPEREASSLAWESKVGPMNPYASDGHSPDRNRFGGIVYSSLRGDGEILTATQLFRTREIWGIDASTLNHHDSYRGETIRIIPSKRYEQVLMAAVKRFLAVGKDVLDYRLPVIIEAGASNTKGLYMTMDLRKYLDPFWGPVHRDHIQKRCELDGWDESAIDGALLAIFNEFFDAVGRPRPERLNDFPPHTSAPET